MEGQPQALACAEKDNRNIRDMGEETEKEKLLSEFSGKLLKQTYGSEMFLTQLMKEQARQSMAAPIINSSRRMALATGLRPAMESVFGFKMDDVGIHTDAAANQAADLLDARAFTKGKDIYFAEGESNFETSQGQVLLAHELTHVAQNKGTTEHIQLKPVTSALGGTNEAQAEMMEHALPRLITSAKSQKGLVEINDVEIKASPGHQEKTLRFLRIKTMIEGLIEPYIYREVLKEPGLSQYLITHDIEVEMDLGLISLDGSIKEDENIAFHVVSKLAWEAVRRAKNKLSQSLQKEKILVSRTKIQMKGKIKKEPISNITSRKNRSVISLGKGASFEHIGKLLKLGFTVLDHVDAVSKWTQGKVKQGISEGAKWSKEQIEKGAAWAEEKAEQAKGTAVKVTKWIGRKTEESYAWTKTQAIKTAKEIKKTAEWTKEKVLQSYEWLEDKAGKASRKIIKLGQEVKEKDHDFAVWRKDVKRIKEDIVFRGRAADEHYDSEVTLGENVAKVDMKLDFFYEKDKSKFLYAFADVETGSIFAQRRWKKSAKLAAPRIGKLIDEGKHKIIEVPGVNSQGLDPTSSVASLVKIADKIGPVLDHNNKTLVICHSAGTDAGVRSMAEIKKRKKSEVYYLMLSPRMKPSRFAGRIKDGGIHPSHVLTVNSILDFPHWPEMNINPWDTLLLQIAKKTYKAWHDYEKNKEAGTHVFITKNYNKRGLPGLDHGSMYNGLLNNDRFDMMVDGEWPLKNITMIQLVHKFLRGLVKTRGVFG